MKNLLLILFSFVTLVCQAQYDTANPKSMAQLHNDGLEYIGKVNKGSSNLGNSQGIDANYKVLKDFYQKNNIPVTKFFTSSNAKSLINQINTMPPEDVLLSNGASKELTSELMKVVDAYRNAKSSRDVEVKVSQIINNSTISGKDKMLFELGASTAIKSAEFWEGAGNNRSSAFHSWAIVSSGNDGPTVMGKVRWKRLLGDLAGVVAGTIASGGNVGVGVGLGTLVSSNID